jgi:hypothetical protein
VRVEFIDPFFEALGWDVRNVQGHAEQYKDVVHEDALKTSRGTRAPDYCFRVGGARKFFLEAKKPSVSVRGDVGPAYQLRRYTWSAKLPASGLFAGRSPGTSPSVVTHSLKSGGTLFHCLLKGCR